MDFRSNELKTEQVKKTQLKAIFSRQVKNKTSPTTPKQAWWPAKSDATLAPWKDMGKQGHGLANHILNHMLISYSWMINWWFGVRWFGFLGSPCERDYSLGVPGKNPKPLGPKPPIYHSLTCMSPKNIYTSMSMKNKNECLNIYIHTVSNTNMGRIILPYSIILFLYLGQPIRSITYL